MPSSRRRFTILACAIAAVFAPAAYSAPFKLSYDLRVHVTGGKTATISNLGDYVILDLYAIVVGANASLSDDGARSGAGAFVSSTGGLNGNLSGYLLAPEFNAGGSVLGEQRDIDGDGDLDVAGANSASINGFFSYRSPDFVTGAPDGRYFVGQARFTATELESATTEIQFTPFSAALYRHLTFIDGVSTSFPKAEIGSELPVLISYKPIVPPGDAELISGVIDQHLLVTRATKASPDAAVTIARGLSIQPGGALDLRNSAGTFEGNEIRIDDELSGNFGGSLAAGVIDIGTTGVAAFRQATGQTRVTTLSIAPTSSALGTLTIDGGTFEAGHTSIGMLGVGVARQSGGTATFESITLGDGTGSEGSYELAGIGQLSVASSLRVGNSGSGSFKQSAGTANINFISVAGASSTADAPSHFEVTGGNLQSSSINVAAHGAADFKGGSVTASRVTVSGSEAGAGKLLLDGGVINATNVMTSGGTIVLRSGTLNVSSSLSPGPHTPDRPGIEFRGAKVNARIIGVGGHEVDREYRLLHAAGDVTVGGLVIRGNGYYDFTGGTLRVSEMLDVDGQLNFAHSAVRLELVNGANAYFTNGRILNAKNVTFVAGPGSLVSFPAHSDPATIFGSFSTEGLIHIVGQPFIVPAGKSIGGTGSISGDITNSGTVTPGHSPGSLSIAGAYTQTETGKLLIELAGTSPDLFDTLSSTGPATLSGNLELALLDNFLPNYADSFTILTASSLTGQFANAQNQLSFSAGTFDILYTPTSVTLTHFTPVPEPTTLLSISAFTATTLLARRRRRV